MKLRYLSLLVILSFGYAQARVVSSGDNVADPADAYFYLRFDNVKPIAVFRTADGRVKDDENNTVMPGYVNQIPSKYLLENKDLRIPFIRKGYAPIDSVHLIVQGNRNIKLPVAARENPSKYSISLPGNNNSCQKGQTYVDSPGNGGKGLCLEDDRVDVTD